jgi:hypothetical protein
MSLRSCGRASYSYFNSCVVVDDNPVCFGNRIPHLQDKYFILSSVFMMHINMGVDLAKKEEFFSKNLNKDDKA